MNERNDHTAILLLAYGAPTSLEDIPAYYSNIRRGRPATSEQVENLIQRYQMIGGSSPLPSICRKIAEDLELATATPVYLGMLHWEPHIETALAKVQADGIVKLTCICLAPQFSHLSVGEYERKTREATAALHLEVDYSFVRSWHLEPAYIDGVAENIRSALRDFPSEYKNKVRLIFSAHSLPLARLPESDPYQNQIRETAAAIANSLNLAEDMWSIAYQSASQRDGTWLGPDIYEVVQETIIDGQTSFLIAPIGFVLDNMEILYDIDIELQQVAHEQNIHLKRIESLNFSPPLIKALVSAISKSSPQTHDTNYAGAFGSTDEK